MASIKRVFVLTGRNVKEILRDPLSLIFLLALPIGMTALFYFVFHGLTEQFSMKYLAPSMVVFGQSFISLFIGMLISTDRASSFIIRLYTTEVKPREFIAAYLASVIPISVLQTVSILLVAVAIDASIFSIGLFIVLLTSLLTSTLFIGFGILFGSVCNEKAVGGVSSMVIMCQSVLSGMWFPVDGLSETFLKVLDVLPFRNGSNLMRSAIELNFGTSDFFTPLLIVAAYGFAMLVLSVFVYGKKMKD